MAGYSGTPLVKKLGIKDGAAVAFLDPPPAFAAALGPLPDAVAVRRDLRAGGLDVIVLFTTSRADLARRFGPAAAKLSQAGGLWIAWPKKASGVATDVTEDVVRGIALDGGLVDNKVCAIDETWSGLRCVRRLRDRTG